MLLSAGNKQAILGNIPFSCLDEIKNTDNPYSLSPVIADELPRAIFVTGRFRSGSTLVWNIFRQCEFTTSYYEPFNERRWFDKSNRGETIDKTHIGVSDYWREYDGLDHLSELYDNAWASAQLYMDQKTWNPAMYRYITELIISTNYTPVLQFNRVDFRLPWLKVNFPNSYILHIYRNPREQWLSFLGDKSLMNKDEVVNSYRDGFYLNAWCEDLSTYFPFFRNHHELHPYEKFYLLWKLSFIYGKIYSNLSFSFESLVSNPGKVLTMINQEVGIESFEVDKLALLVEEIQVDRWRSYADDNWFSKFESSAEKTLNQFLS